MRAPRCSACLLLCLALVACGRRSPRNAVANTARASDSQSEAIPTDSVTVSAVRFTQGFYDWYRTIDDADRVAVQRRPELFGAQLLSALRADNAAQRRCPGYICGLDWDPFTASQDPCDPYRAGGGPSRGDTIIVTVTHVGCTDSAEARGPDLLAKLRRVDGHWQFVDFEYPWSSGGFSLLRELADLAAERDSNFPSRKR